MRLFKINGLEKCHISVINIKTLLIGDVSFFSDILPIDIVDSIVLTAQAVSLRKLQLVPLLNFNLTSSLPKKCPREGHTKSPGTVVCNVNHDIKNVMTLVHHVPIATLEVWVAHIRIMTSNILTGAISIRMSWTSRKKTPRKLHYNQRQIRLRE